MNLSVVVCIMIMMIAICITALVTASPRSSDKYIEADSEGYLYQKREKRAVVSFFEAIVKMTSAAIKTVLLQGSKYIGTDENVKVYAKVGGSRQALKDFDSLKLKDVRDEAIGVKKGRLGDATIVIKDTNLPYAEKTISVYRKGNSGKITHQILYGRSNYPEFWDIIKERMKQ